MTPGRWRARVKVYRARAIHGPVAAVFDPLDSRDSVAGPAGWRFNDLKTEILYTAEVEALATIEVPDGSIVDLDELGIVLPRTWNARPVQDDSRVIAREFLDAVAALPPGRAKPVGLRVPSVVSSSAYNVLLDPSRRSEYRASITGRIPFNTLRSSRS